MHRHAGAKLCPVEPAGYSQDGIADCFTLEATEVILFISFFSGNANLTKIGGIVGIVTAAVAWFASSALVANGMAGHRVVPVGPPIWRDRPVAPVQAAPTAPAPPVQTRVS